MTLTSQKFCIRCALDSLYTYTEWGGSRLGGSHLHTTKKTFINRELKKLATSVSLYTNVTGDIIEYTKNMDVITCGRVDIYECPECHMRYEFGISKK